MQHIQHHKYLHKLSYNLIYQTGLFTNTCYKWTGLQQDQKTWDDFKSHFVQAHKDNMQQQNTVKQTGLHAANSVLANMHASNTSTIQELANAATVSRQKMEQLLFSKTNYTKMLRI